MSDFVYDHLGEMPDRADERVKEIINQLQELNEQHDIKLSEVTKRQDEALSYAKEVDQRLSEENKDDRRKSNNQFWLSFIVANVGVLIGIIGFFVH